MVGILKREPSLAIAADEIRDPFNLHVMDDRTLSRVHPERAAVGAKPRDASQRFLGRRRRLRFPGPACRVHGDVARDAGVRVEDVGRRARIRARRPVGKRHRTLDEAPYTHQPARRHRIVGRLCGDAEDASGHARHDQRGPSGRRDITHLRLPTL